MRIKSGTTLTEQNVREAGAFARSQGHDIWIDELLVGKRGAITVYCESHTGNRRCNGREGYSASWTAWGWFIADLFSRDSEATIGFYKGVEDFVKQCRQMAQYNGHSIDFLAHLPRASAAVAA